MGLDNFAVYGSSHPSYDHSYGADNSMPNHLFPSNKLCGGLFSGGGNSFRGKVYDDLVQYFTDYTLYSDELFPEDVMDIASTLNQITQEKYDEWVRVTGNSWEISYDEVKELAVWFGVVASNEGSVVSWY